MAGNPDTMTPQDNSSLSEADKWPNQEDTNEEIEDTEDQDDANPDDDPDAENEGDGEVNESEDEEKPKRESKRRPDAEARIAELTSKLREREREVESLKPHADRARKFQATLADFEKSGLSDDASVTDATLRDKFGNDLNALGAQLRTAIDNGEITAEDANQRYASRQQDYIARIDRAKQEREVSNELASLKEEKESLRQLRYDTLLERAVSKHKLPDYAVGDVRDLVTDPDKVEAAVEKMAKLINQSKRIAVSNTNAKRPVEVESQEPEAKPRVRQQRSGTGDSPVGVAERKSGSDMSFAEAWNATVRKLGKRR